MPAPNTVLINPPNPRGYVSNKDSMGGFGQLYPAGAPPFPPLDMPYLAATLTSEGHSVAVVEAGALRLSEEAALDAVASAVESGSLCVVRTSLPTIDVDLAFCSRLRSRTPEARVVLYGPVTSPLFWRIQQEPAVDVVVFGEADQQVLDLARGTALASVPGIAWRDGTGWRSNSPRKAERELDKLPFPQWDLFPCDRYVVPPSSVTGSMRFLPMLSSRGCPFGCNYCPYPVGQGLLWRYRSPANVVDELEHLVRDLKVEFVIFRDPLFSANKKRVVDICEEITRRGIQVQWRCETRIDCLDETTIAAMARAGCTGVNFGVESTDPQVQKNVERKPITETQFLETVAEFQRHRIATFAFFVIGLPGDTIDTILASIRFATRLNASWIQFTVATPFIGTRLHDWASGLGLVARDHYRIISSHEGSIGNENLSPAQVHRLHRFAQILQHNFINRRGILKNEHRQDLVYRMARRAANLMFGWAGGAFYQAGSLVLRATMRGTRRGGATLVAPTSTPEPNRSSG